MSADGTSTTIDRCYHNCPRCHGTGGPPPIWDEELSRSFIYDCARCNGRGGVWHWTDEPCATVRDSR